ncbi:centrosomal protein of 63 kDa isoform X2 [Erpetoichthys calabaricus]|uniref:centrosomal protein of 63 kDa isoform X2 n=1 Tax=Erpetoichthys calabaricus TaxID=27687 RepID=UPI0010A00D92|nr:centrosomal protein of 63 kDa isoform X2 [Erpetoichthys calabaricus]
MDGFFTGNTVMEQIVEGFLHPEQTRVTGCEAELQELMRQIDIMVNQKKAEWERQTQTLEARLEAREKELISTRFSLDAKNHEAGMLIQRLEDMERSNQEIVFKYEEKLNALQSELEKLKYSYGKLQRHHSKRAREASKELADDEIDKLNKKLEEFRAKSKEWDTQRAMYQIELASLEEQRRSLNEKCEIFQQQKDVTEPPRNSGASPGRWGFLDLPQEAIPTEDLKSTVQELTTKRRELQEEKQRLLLDLQQSRSLRQKAEEELSEVRLELQSCGNLLRTSEQENAVLRKEMAKLQEQLARNEDSYRLQEQNSKHRMSTELLNLKLALESSEQQLQMNHKTETILKTEITQLQARLETSHSHCMQLRDTLIRSKNGLVFVEEEKNKEINMLKESLLQMEACHSSEMRQLQAEMTEVRATLQQKDSALAEAMEKASHLEDKLLKCKGKPTEYQVAMIQLHALTVENKQLKELIGTLEAQTGSSLHRPHSKLKMETVRFEEEVSAVPNDLAQQKVQQGSAFQYLEEHVKGSGEFLQQQNGNKPQMMTPEPQVILDSDELDHDKPPQALSPHNPPDEPFSDLSAKTDGVEERPASRRGTSAMHDSDFIEEDLSHASVFENVLESLPTEEEFMLLAQGQSIQAVDRFLQEEDRRIRELEQLFDFYINKMGVSTHQAVQSCLKPKLL